MRRGRRARRLARLLPLALAVAASAAFCLLGPPDPGRLDPPLAWAPPSPAHPLGCGEAGVDLAAVVAHGALAGIVLAASVAVVGLAVGAPLGAFAAIRRGRVERVVDRTCDLVQSFPSFLLAMTVLAAVRHPGRVHLACVFLLTAWAPFARLALTQARVLRALAFVDAAAALGATPAAVLVRHVLPNLFGVLAVQLGSSAAALVVSEAALAFVGLGPPDGVSLGAVVDQGVAAMLRAPHVLFVGAGAVAVVSFALLLAGRVVDADADRA